jgi:hypothetical protein
VKVAPIFVGVMSFLAICLNGVSLGLSGVALSVLRPSSDLSLSGVSREDTSSHSSSVVLVPSSSLMSVFMKARSASTS